MPKFKFTEIVLRMPLADKAIIAFYAALEVAEEVFDGVYGVAIFAVREAAPRAIKRFRTQ